MGWFDKKKKDNKKAPAPAAPAAPAPAAPSAAAAPAMDMFSNLSSAPTSGDDMFGYATPRTLISE